MKLNVGYLLLGLLVVIIAVTNYLPGTILTGGDNLHPEFNPLLNIHRSIFAVWQEYQGLGLLGGMGHAADIPRQIVVLILSLLVPMENIRYLTTFLYLSVGVFGAYFLLRKVLKPFNSSDMFPLVGAAFYLLNLGTVQAFYVPFEVFTTHFAFLPWLFWGTINYFQNPNPKDTLLLGAILFLATPGAYVPTLFLVFVLSTIILIPFLLAKFSLKNNLWKIGKFYLVVFIVNVFWLLPFLYFAATSATAVLDAKINQMSSDTNFLKNKEFGNAFDVVLLRSFWFNNTDFNINKESVFLMQPWRDHLANPAVLGIGYLLFAIAAVGALWTAKERGSKPAIGFLGIFVFAFMMLATDTPPFSWINQIFRQIPFFAEAFRFPFTKFSILASLTYSIFFAFGLIYISELVKKITPIREKFLSHGLVLAAAILLAIFTFPIFQRHLFYEKTRLKFPAEYRELFEFFKKQNPSTRIANFPQHTFWSWNFYEWGYSGSGFLWYGIEQPILDRAFDPWSRENENYYWEISHALYSKNPALFEKIFDKYQISWVLVDGNVINPPSPKDLFLDELEKMLTASDKFRLDITFGKIKVYQVKLDTPVNNFVFFAQSLPAIEPGYKWNNFDAAFSENNHYVSQIQNSRFQIPNSTIYPFRSLFTGKRQEDIEFNVEEKEDSFVFVKTFDKTLQDYALEIPDIDVKALTWINPYDLSRQKFLHPDIFFDGKSLTVEVPKIKGYLSEQIDPAYDSSLAVPKNCSQLENGTVQNEIVKEKENLFLRLFASNAINCSASFNMPDLPHNIGYLITVKARNKEGKSLLFWLENLNTRKADIETYLPKNPKSSFDPELRTEGQIPDSKFYFIQPPMEDDGVGYSLHFDNISIGNEKTVNDLGKITVNPIPYEFLTQTSLEPIVPSVLYRRLRAIPIDLSRTENFQFEIEVKHPNPSIYQVNKLPSYQVNKSSILVLSQAYHNGWNAYIPNSRFQILNSQFLLPLFGKKIENHVLVDNWANGWVLDKDRDGEIVIIFWPQYLEYLGFFLLFAYFLSFFRGILKNRMADTDNKTLKDIIQEEGEGKHEHSPSQSPAVRDEEEASGSSPGPTSDDDIDKMVEEVTGQEPEQGKTFNEMVDEAEADRRGPPKEPEPQEET